MSLFRLTRGFDAAERKDPEQTSVIIRSVNISNQLILGVEVKLGTGLFESAMQANTTRGFLWSDVETRTLLNIWGEQDIQAALDGNFRNSFVYRDVSRRLGAMGFERTPEQCRVRIKSLKRQYLLAKEGNLRNNGQYHKICKFYDTMERILSNRPTLDAQEFLESSAGGEEAIDGPEEDGEDAQDAYSESTGECPYPAETEVKLEYPTVPIPIPVKVTVGNNSESSLPTITFFHNFVYDADLSTCAHIMFQPFLHFRQLCETT